MEDKKNFLMVMTVTMAMSIFLVIGTGILCSKVFFAEASSTGGPGGMPPQGGPQGNSGGPGNGKGNFTIPTAAITACSSSSEKATCSFSTTDSSGTSKTMSGTCIKNPKDTTELACMPTPKDNNGQGDNGKQMEAGSFSIPTESVAACSSSSEKATCSFSTTGSSGVSKTMSGTCMKNPKDTTELFCAPAKKDGTDVTSDTVATATERKSQRSENITKIESRIEKIITFLESQNVDITTIESNFDAFKEKADDLLAAFDTYIAALGGTDTAIISSARENVRSASNAMMDYFNSTLRKSIDDALSQLE
jgi:hypothetical protein